MEKIKGKVKEGYTTTRRRVLNAEQFVQASALTVLCGWSWYVLRKYGATEITQWVVTGAIAVTAVRAFVEYIKFLDRK
jgi:hypothetical protein